MIKGHQNYYLKGVLDSVAFLAKQAINAINIEEEDADPIVDKLTELKEEMETSIETIGEYITDYLNYDIKGKEENYCLGENDEPTEKGDPKYYLKGILDSIIFGVGKAINAVNEEENEELIVNKLIELKEEMETSIAIIDEYTADSLNYDGQKESESETSDGENENEEDEEEIDYIDKYEERLIDTLRSALVYTSEALLTMDENDLEQVREQFDIAANEITDYYDEILCDDFYSYEEKYYDEVSDKKINVEWDLKDLVASIEKAINDMDYNNLTEVEVRVMDIQESMDNYLKETLAYYDNNEIPKLVQLNWEFRKIIKIIDLYLGHQQGNNEIGQYKIDKANCIDGLKGMLKFIANESGEVLDNMNDDMDDYYLRRMSYVLDKILEPITNGTMLLFSINDNVASLTEFRTDTCCESLAKAVHDIRRERTMNDTKAILKKKFIAVEKVIESCLNELEKDYENYE